MTQAEAQVLLHFFGQMFNLNTVLFMLTCSKKLVPWESRESRSISPNLTPPPRFRPFTGCRVRISVGPVDRTYKLMLWYI